MVKHIGAQHHSCLGPPKPKG
uniref:Uncharacterized protein n=1 Tax=Anguilla anguilla TaxID=7936 RepID=A0A0E9TXT3_ANGAN